VSQDSENFKKELDSIESRMRDANIRKAAIEEENMREWETYHVEMELKQQDREKQIQR